MRPRLPPSYRRAALQHPAQALAVIGAVLLAFVFAGYGVPTIVPVVIALAAEVAVIAFLPRLAFFRRCVDAHLAERERREAAAAHALVGAALAPEHRRELESLDLVADEVRTRCGIRRPSEDWTGATELVDLFGRAALAHRSRIDTFGLDVGPALAEQALIVERKILVATGDLRCQLSRHLEILRQRESAWASARHDLGRLTVVLATIADQIRWIREQCALSSWSALEAEIDSVLVGSRESARVACEVPIAHSERALVNRPRVALDGTPPAPASDVVTASDPRTEELATAAAISRVA